MPGQLDVISASVAQHHAIFGAFHPLQYSMSRSIAPTVCLWTIGKQRRLSPLNNTAHIVPSVPVACGGTRAEPLLHGHLIGRATSTVRCPPGLRQRGPRGGCGGAAAVTWDFISRPHLTQR